MSLNDLWFILIGVLFCGFFFLEGFDYGVGMLVPLIGKDDMERRFIINTIGPVWDSNEVWLLTAGGATFAAFPGWYATMFSGFYLALFLVLAALIVRGVAFEFRSKVESPVWRKNWDMGIGISSLLPPLLFGVAMSDLIKGLPIDASKEFAGNFFDLLSIPTVVVGLTAVLIFVFHGAVFLTMKLEGPILDKVYKTAKLSGAFSLVFALLTAVFAAFTTDIFQKPFSALLAVVSLAALVVSYLTLLKKRGGLSMILNAVTIISAVASLFAGLYPRVMVSSLNNDYSLTVFNVSSTPYTLKLMTIVALSVLPFVLGYLAWTYWVFKRRITLKDLRY